MLAYFLQFLHGWSNFLIQNLKKSEDRVLLQYFYIKTDSYRQTKKNDPGSRTVWISFSFASFFSIVFWALIFLHSYILVPAASSIIARIWNRR